AEFEEKFPAHDLKPIAEIGRAQCLEAMGRTDEALQAFAAFLAAHPDHYLTPVATFGKGRTLEQAGKLQDAKAVYEDYLVANPSNDWSARAQSSLLFVQKTMRAVESGAGAAPAPQQPITFEPIQLQGLPP
ncbi:MAG TPA: tetratricopeptide repeat protein, partial [Kiritimatiellia bacterium]